MRYVVGFGSANAAQQPTWTKFTNSATWAELAPQPTLAVTDSAGRSYFDVDWSVVQATSISYVVSLNGVDLEGTISSDGTTTGAGTAIATAATTSLTGYSTVGPLVARALVQSGFQSLTQAQIAAFDPIASTDKNVAQAVDLLNWLGTELASAIKTHLEREFTITTAGSALSYALPSDYLEMVDDSLWNNSGIYPLSGPITPQAERFLHAWNGVTTVRIPFRILGNRITFPVAPGNGLEITGLYISRNWVQTSGATSPDADHVTTSSDYVLFDPTLVVLGLKWKLLSAIGSVTAPMALAEYERRLEWAKGQVSGARALSLNGRGSSGFRLIDNFNLPVTGWGLP